MRILIVEDETAAYENLLDILTEIDLGIEVTGYTESISQTVHWLQNNPAPDLILMDIHLSDGSAFSIFKAMLVETPVIFTTAYDEYALDAFKVNSIDYLLKPIKADELRNALEKFNKLKQPDILQYLSQLNQLSQVGKQRDKILIPYKDQLLPVDLTEIACIYSTEKSTRIYLRNGKFYPYCKTLDQICATLDPVNFIRANKQFVIARNSVKNITIWFDSRLLITLDVEVPERIYVSKNKASEFKAWVTNEQ
jgi:two-component system, LytTR family, response regulator LytT